MSTVTVTELIDVPVGDIWRVLVDLPARADWLCTADTVELLTPGRFEVGTAWRETRTQPDGASVAEEFCVLEAVAPRLLVLSSPGLGVDYQITWTLREVHRRRRSRTAVTVGQQAVPTAPSGRVLALLFGGLAARTVERALRRDLADLSAAAHAAGPGSAAAA